VLLECAIVKGWSTWKACAVAAYTLHWPWWRRIKYPPNGKWCGHIVLMQTAVQNCYSKVGT